MKSQNENQASETPSMRSQTSVKKRLFRKLCCVGSAVVFCLILSLAGSLSFPAGQRGLIRLIDQFSSGLQIGQINGGLQDGLELKDVAYQADGLAVNVAKTRLQINLACLWNAEICVNDLTLEQPDITLITASLTPSSADERPNNAPMQRIALPFGLDVQNITLRDFALKIDETQFTLKTLQSAVSLNNESGLTLAPTLLEEGVVTVQQITEIEPTKAPAPVDWDELERQLTPPLLNLDGVQLPFALHLQSIEGKNWQYRQIDRAGAEVQQISMPTALVSADMDDRRIQLQQLALNSSVLNLKAQGVVHLNDDFPLDIQLNANINEIKSADKTLFPSTQIHFKASGALKNTTLLTLNTQGGLAAQLVGKVELNREKTPFNLQLAVSQGEFSFAEGTTPLKIAGLNAQLTGTLPDYQLNLNGNVEGLNHIPKTKINVVGRGKLYEISAEQAKLSALNGFIELTGFIRWKDGLQWQSEAMLNNMNIRPYLPEMPAILSGTLHSQGLINETAEEINIPQLALNGTLSQRPFSLNGSFFLNHGQLNIPALTLTYGENKASAQGWLGDHSNFKFDINAPYLTGLWDDLSGALSGAGNISGSMTTPLIRLELFSPKLHFHTLNLNNASAKGDIDAQNLLAGDISFSVERLQYGEDVALSDLKIKAFGNETNHQLTLQSRGTPVAPNFKISGKFDRTLMQWQGSINDVHIASLLGEFKTNQPLMANYDDTQTLATINAHCWQNNDIDVCFPQRFKVGLNGEIPFEIKKIDLALVNKLIERETLQGRLQSVGKVAWFTDKPLQLSMDVKGANLGVAYKLDYRTFALTIPTLSLNAEVQNNNLALKSDLHIQNQGRINADINVKDLAKTRLLNGNLSIAGLNLSLINQLLAYDEAVNGNIESALTFGGSLEKPTLSGRFEINHLRSKLRSAPAEITNGNIDVRFSGTTSTLHGNIETTDSRLHLEGRANWTNLADWTTEVRAEANQFHLDIPNVAKLKISPNVTVKVTPKQMELFGNVEIPWARIAIESLPDSAESVSEDEVILNGPNKSKEELINRRFAAATKSGVPINADLKINIGEDVTLDAYGLKTYLNGLLAIKQDKGSLGLFGQINLEKGRYASFGQDLLIRKGQISFSGLPSQPMLNITAVRNPQAMEDSKVTAGIKVLGIADSPDVKVFTEPAMPQDQALSYLLTGRSLENSGEAGSSGSIGAALLGLGLSKSGKLVGGIGEAFGIQDLNLGTAGVGESSKVVVSGNITNRLQVKYGVGLFDGLAEITLRYRLMPRLYFQSISGTNQVFDLLYRFEF